MVLFVFNDTSTTEIYTLSLHDALPICAEAAGASESTLISPNPAVRRILATLDRPDQGYPPSEPGRRETLARSLEARSEEHTSELQSRQYLVCRLLLDKKKSL